MIYEKNVKLWMYTVWIRHYLRHQSTTLPVPCPLRIKKFHSAQVRNCPEHIIMSVLPTCNWCLCVWRDPVDIGCANQHVLCRECFETHKQSSTASQPDCPLKCGPILSRPGFRSNAKPALLLRRMIGKLEMRCIIYIRNPVQRKMLRSLNDPLSKIKVGPKQRK